MAFLSTFFKQQSNVKPVHMCVIMVCEMRDIETQLQRLELMLKTLTKKETSQKFADEVASCTSIKSKAITCLFYRGRFPKL